MKSNQKVVPQKILHRIFFGFPHHLLISLMNLFNVYTIIPKYENSEKYQNNRTEMSNANITLDIIAILYDETMSVLNSFPLKKSLTVSTKSRDFFKT